MHLPGYTQWLSHFKATHGELDTQRKINLTKLSESYSIEVNSHKRLFKLLYAIENLYGALLVLFAARSLTHSFTTAELCAYLDFSFFRERGIYNYHPPKNLVFYQREFIEN